MQTYKREAQERMKELNDKLQQQENELKDTREKFAAYRDEMSDAEDRIESLALDVEMGEEKVSMFCASPSIFILVVRSSKPCVRKMPP